MTVAETQTTTTKILLTYRKVVAVPPNPCKLFLTLQLACSEQPSVKKAGEILSLK